MHEEESFFIYFSLGCQRFEFCFLEIFLSEVSSPRLHALFRVHEQF